MRSVSLKVTWDPPLFITQCQFCDFPCSTDDDSDGELFSEATAAQARNGASAALNASTPSVYRAPVLENEAGHRRDGPGPGRGGAGGDPPGMPPPPEYSSNAAMTQGERQVAVKTARKDSRCACLGLMSACASCRRVRSRCLQS